MLISDLCFQVFWNIAVEEYELSTLKIIFEQIKLILRSPMLQYAIFKNDTIYILQKALAET